MTPVKLKQSCEIGIKILKMGQEGFIWFLQLGNSIFKIPESFEFILKTLVTINYQKFYLGECCSHVTFLVWEKMNKKTLFWHYETVNQASALLVKFLGPSCEIHSKHIHHHCKRNKGQKTTKYSQILGALGKRETLLCKSSSESKSTLWS